MKLPSKRTLQGVKLPRQPPHAAGSETTVKTHAAGCKLPSHAPCSRLSHNPSGWACAAGALHDPTAAATSRLCRGRPTRPDRRCNQPRAEIERAPQAPGRDRSAASRLDAARPRARPAPACRLATAREPRGDRGRHVGAAAAAVASPHWLHPWPRCGDGLQPATNSRRLHLEAKPVPSLAPRATEWNFHRS